MFRPLVMVAVVGLLHGCSQMAEVLPRELLSFDLLPVGDERALAYPPPPEAAPRRPSPRLASLRPPPKPPPPAASPRPPAADLMRLIGMGEQQVLAVLGEPGQRRMDGASSVWSYGEAPCRLEVFFFVDVESGDMHALAYRLAGERTPPAADRCPAALEVKG